MKSATFSLLNLNFRLHSLFLIPYHSKVLSPTCCLLPCAHSEIFPASILKCYPRFTISPFMATSWNPQSVHWWNPFACIPLPPGSLSACRIFVLALPEFFPTSVQESYPRFSAFPYYGNFTRSIICSLVKPIGLYSLTFSRFFFPQAVFCMGSFGFLSSSSSKWLSKILDFFLLWQLHDILSLLVGES